MSATDLHQQCTLDLGGGWYSHPWMIVPMVRRGSLASLNPTQTTSHPCQTQTTHKEHLCRLISKGLPKTVPVVELGVEGSWFLGQLAWLGPTGDGFQVFCKKNQKWCEVPGGLRSVTSWMMLRAMCSGPSSRSIPWKTKCSCSHKSLTWNPLFELGLQSWVPPRTEAEESLKSLLRLEAFTKALLVTWGWKNGWNQFKTDIFNPLLVSAVQQVRLRNSRNKSVNILRL